MSEAGIKELVEDKLSQEESALAKVCEINVPGTLAYVTTVDDLPAIFEVGAISEKFAKRIGRRYQMHWERYSDPRRVYIAKLRPKGEGDFESLEKLALEIGWYPKPEQVAVLILSPEIEKKTSGSDQNWEAERLIKYRFAPKYLLGIAVGGSNEPTCLRDYAPLREEITTMTKDRELIEGLKDRVLNLMKKAFAGHPERFLPIYDLNCNLLWPERDQS